MRKFKLVKKYPACNLEIGSYIEFTGNCQQIIDINGNFLKSDLEKFTEFWEEIVEKDYEILMYRSKINTDIYFDNPEYFSRLNSDWEIYSIRRKSDGVEFKIGDKVYNPNCKSQTFIIESFYLDCNNIHLLCGKGHINITKIEHYKEPILITEDGVEIFKGDIHWRLIAVIKENRTLTFLEKSDEKGAFPYRGGGGKFFSTKEAAEKYLNENKPMYSKKEVIDFGGYILRNLKGVMPMKLLFELWLRENGN